MEYLHCYGKGIAIWHICPVNKQVLHRLWHADTLIEQESNFLQLISCVWKNASSQNSHN